MYVLKLKTAVSFLGSGFEHMTNRTFYLTATLLFVIYLINGFFAIPRLSITYDEADHLNYGVRFIKGHSEKVILFDDASTMPVSALNAIPRGIEQVFNKDLHRNDGGVRDILSGRYVTVVVCLFIGVFVCLWSREMFGKLAGLLSLFFFVFCPNLNANATLVTTDAYTALFALATSYFFYRFVLYSGWTNFLAFSVLIGFSQAVKQSLILLFFFFAAASLLVLLQRRSLFRRFQINLLRLVILCLVVMFCINVAFLFNGTGMTLAQYKFYSRFFLDVQQIKFLNVIPLPLPAPFVQGFDMIKYMLGIGSGHPETSPRSYIFGTYFTGRGPWYYYPAVILFKTPLSVFVLLLMLLWKHRRRKLAMSWIHFFPLIIALLFLLTVMLLNTSQHSIRHLVLIYPLIFVGVGSLFQSTAIRHRLLIAGLMIYSVATFYFYYPNLIAYTNELLWNKTKVYKTIASSNIDFGQGGRFLAQYLSTHKGVEKPDKTAKAGNFILDINSYIDLRGDGEYKWLRLFSPVGHANHCYLLFSISEQELKAKGLK